MLNKYWKKKLWNEYYVKVKVVHILYNPFNFWGVMPEDNYILYTFSRGFKKILCDRIFHSVEDIVKYLEEEKKNYWKKFEDALKGKD